ncbi:PfkB family carbohydrate kinase [Demequina mangrovi]|uniref:Sugar or nucleoside kinase, ribokinase family n=1 Tax=Demequina mangrovi TaxID=1043493 RepID=A0A1H6VJ07_9MICO|nr:PfkB family carbohydrate kinase [Demequina mangrovi]SEJ00332.1 Sugar or nucleoside kinase, ribokinase family [Demequina mangrovi]
MTTSALFAGLATLDIVQLVERLPSPNEKVAALEFAVCAGGPATNAAVAFARCGGAPTLVTALPAHELTALVTGDLSRCGVDVLAAASYDGPPVTASIMVTRATGDRAVVSPSGVATGGGLAPVTEAPLDGVGAVLIDGYFPEISLPLAARARAAGIPVVLDAGSHKPHTDSVAAACDIAVVSDDYAPPGTRGEPEAVLAHLAGLGVGTAVITRGAGAVLWRSPQGAGEVEVPPVSPVIDTLGAGDFFHGALTWRIAELGRDDARLGEDIAFAASVVAESLGSFGTRAWLG